MWNKRDLAAFPRHVHPQVRFHPPRGPERDYAGYLAMATDFQRAFPDLRFTIESIVAQDDRASARLVIEGTNDGPWRGRPATGHRVRVVGHPHVRVEDRLIVEFWQLFDELDLTEQLGHR